MDHRIEQRAPFVVTGMEIRCVPGPAVGVEIPRLWDTFAPQMHSVPGRIGAASFGVCRMIAADGAPAPASGPGPFLYAAAVATSPDAPVPAGMVRLTVPGGKYAVFTYRGPIRAFGAFVHDLWCRVLPASGLKPTGAPDFEEYGADFDAEKGPVDVWVPVA